MIIYDVKYGLMIQDALNWASPKPGFLYVFKYKC